MRRDFERLDAQGFVVRVRSRRHACKQGLCRTRRPLVTSEKLTEQWRINRHCPAGCQFCARWRLCLSGRRHYHCAMIDFIQDKRIKIVTITCWGRTG